MNKTTIDFKIPEGWTQLSGKQLSYVYKLISEEFSSDEIKTLCLLRWCKTKVIGRQDNGAYLLKKGKDLFEVSPIAIAEVLVSLDWITSTPDFPVRIPRIRRAKALPADFSGVPFKTFIICDNLYHGYLSTQNENLLEDLGCSLYGKSMKFTPSERIGVFYWFLSLKNYLSRKYSDFFQPATSDNLLGSSAPDVESAMNAQIRALTKGDVTKESEILALDTHRALTELNAQAREYKELKAKMK